MVEASTSTAAGAPRSHVTFAMMRDEIKRIYLTPLLEIHKQPNGYIKMEDLERSYTAVQAYIAQSGGQRRIATSYLEQLHASQLLAYSEYFYQQFWSKRAGQDLLNQWKQQLASIKAKEDVEDRILRDVLHLNVSQGDRVSKSGRYSVANGWHLPLDVIYKWIVDPLVKETTASLTTTTIPIAAEEAKSGESDVVLEDDDDNYDEEGEVNDEEENEEQEGEADDHDEEEGEVNENDDNQATETEVDDEEEGEVDETKSQNVTRGTESTSTPKKVFEGKKKLLSGALGSGRISTPKKQPAKPTTKKRAANALQTQPNANKKPRNVRSAARGGRGGRRKKQQAQT